MFKDSGSGAPAVEVDDLHKTYRGDVTALDGLTFAVEAGGVFALLGPNGAGKSTTVRILTTLSRPDRGTARVGGLNVLTDARAVRQRIGVVTQASGSVLHLTGRENLTLQARIYGLGRVEGRARVGALLAHFDLEDAADRVVRGYSGGMRRRLDIALGLIHQPAILFLDEPTTGLDPEARVLTWRALGTIATAGHLTVVLTTHYLEEADQFAGRVAIVDRGRVVAEGSPGELKRSLDGDSVEVELASADAAARAAGLVGRAVGAVVVPDGSRVTARVGDGARVLPAVLAALDAGGVTPVALRLAQATLEDVYLRVAGRSFHDADGARGVAA